MKFVYNFKQLIIKQMQTHITFNIAKVFNKLGYDEKTDYLYLNNYGIKAVKGDLNDPIAERIYHQGDIVRYDETWGIIYPSTYWIPAPYVFDIVIWLKNIFNIIIEPVLADQRWTYKIYYPELFSELNIIDNEEEIITDILKGTENNINYLTIEKAFEKAINEIALLADKNNWVDKLNL